jgi:hypothetical protein
MSGEMNNHIVPRYYLHIDLGKDVSIRSTGEIVSFKKPPHMTTKVTAAAGDKNLH